MELGSTQISKLLLFLLDGADLLFSLSMVFKIIFFSAFAEHNLSLKISVVYNPFSYASYIIEILLLIFFRLVLHWFKISLLL